MWACRQAPFASAEPTWPSGSQRALPSAKNKYEYVTARPPQRIFLSQPDADDSGSSITFVVLHDAPLEEGKHLVARSNFGFQKYQKELKRKKKGEAKRQRSLNRKSSTTEAPPPDSTQELPTDSDSGNPAATE